MFDIFDRASHLMLVQLQIIRSGADRISSILSDIGGTLQAELFDDEIDAATALMKHRHLRAAGAVAGEVLERHLARIASNHGITLRKRNPTIADLNDPLKDSKIYDLPRWRQIQHLADLRNLCVHSKDREPTDEEVRSLIDGTAAVIKSVF
jgi:hypothetical protein